MNSGAGRGRGAGSSPANKGRGGGGDLGGGGRRGRGGRGRGGRRSESAGGNRSRSNTPSSKTNTNDRNSFRTGRRSAATSPAIKKDGELGAAAHTVSEEYRIQLTEVLMSLRETDNQDSITMPPDLTNTQRKFVHELARQFGLKSKSYGKGEDRRVVVSKILVGAGGMNNMMGSLSNNQNERKSDNDLPLEEDYKNVPRVDVGKNGMEALMRHLIKYPPTRLEEAESKETGSCMFLKKKEDRGDNNTSVQGSLPGNIKETTSAPFVTDRQKDKAKLEARINYYRTAQEQMKKSPQYTKMRKQRQKLPAFEYANDICNIMRNRKNKVLILTGDTGCGKSTQVPQFLLDDEEIGPSCKIIITQPRRISAISVAERVAQERCEAVGNSVGYSVRLESCLSKKTQLVFLTPGVLMKKLHTEDETGGETVRLKDINVIIMDEIHERDKNTEFLMIALQDLIKERDDLQLILMSATMPTRDLAEYWRIAGTRENEYKPSSLNDDDDNWSNNGVMPVEINIPGRTYPVEEYFLEDVLKVTGFVDRNEEGSDMLELEADLVRLLGGNQQNSTTSSSISTPTLLESRLKCVMCNKAGFSSAEELGSHIAMCTGLLEESMSELEDRVRSVANFDSYLSVPGEDTAGGRDGDDLYDIMEIEMEDYDDEDDDEGALMQKWDGETPFVAADSGGSNKLTLTEEETLMRYQSMYDDEEVNYDFCWTLCATLISHHMVRELF